MISSPRLSMPAPAQAAWRPARKNRRRNFRRSSPNSEGTAAPTSPPPRSMARNFAVIPAWMGGEFNGRPPFHNQRVIFHCLFYLFTKLSGPRPHDVVLKDVFSKSKQIALLK